MAPERRKAFPSASLSESAESNASSSEPDSAEEFNGNSSRKRRKILPTDVGDTDLELDPVPLLPTSRIKPRKTLATTDVRPSDLEKPTISNGKTVDSSLSFATLGAAPWLITSLANMAITRPTGIQKRCIPKILEGRDVIGGSKTGSGKTVAFTVPILQSWAENPMGIYAVILTPTRELALQILEQVKAISSSQDLKAILVVGGTEMRPQAIALGQRPHVVIATPGRLADHITTSGSDTIQGLRRTRIVVLDEADRLLASGSGSMLPDVETCLSVLPPPNERQTCLFTATVTPEVMALKSLPRPKDRPPIFVCEVDSSDLAVPASLHQTYLQVPLTYREAYLHMLLLTNRNAAKKAVIIFCNRTATANLLERLLRSLEHRVTSLHSLLSQSERTSNLARFRAAAARIMVATDVASRGLDIPEVDLVINYDVPRNPDDYIHRVGRTARAGKTGEAITLVGQRDVQLFLAIEERVAVKMEAYEEEGVNIQTRVVRDGLKDVGVKKREAILGIEEGRDIKVPRWEQQMMPPSTGLRRSSRKRSAETRARLDRDPLVESSPSRLAKRKKPNATTTRRPRRLQTPDSQPSDDDESEDSSAEDQAIANKIIPHLGTSNIPVSVAIQHNNAKAEGNQTVQAYAKFCGRDWTYYVQKVRVVLGRPSDVNVRHASMSSPVSLNGAPNVDIDLGPSKMISRCHAELLYKDHDATWCLKVNGRNGVKRNDQMLRKDQETALGSGDVLEIDGTQMMFITADTPAEIHPMFLNRIQELPHQDKTARANKQSHAHPPTSYAPAPSSPSQHGITSATNLSRSNGGTVIAPAPPDYVKPVTPNRSPKKQPRTSSALKESPTFKRGYVIETSEQIDFKDDATKDLKPMIPYSVMITQAILSTPEECIPLNKIYDFITANFAYYRHLTTNWQNSIRHNLSLNSFFEKIARGPNDPGKGNKWRLVEGKRNEAIQAVVKHMKKSNARPPSVPISPAVLRDEAAASQNALAPAQYSSETNGVMKTSPPQGLSPNPSAYPIAQESYTPTRSSRDTMLVSHDHSQNVPVLSDDVSPLPIRRNNLRAGATDSSPVLPSAIFDGAMLTPAPRQHNLRFPQPATIKPPTSHMIYSSPAPFWKQAGDLLLGSTPMRGFPETSPLKASNNDDYQSSSPPPAATNGNESPTKGRGGSTYTVSTMKGDDLEEENEGEIDLTKGFTKISTYHQRRSAGAATGTTV